MRLGFRIALIFITALMGCGKPQPDAEFKAHVALLQRNNTNHLFAPISYDIRKTDSLISPFMGEIEWGEANAKDYALKGENHFVFVWSKRLTLAYQEHRWILKKTETKLDLFKKEGDAPAWELTRAAAEWHDSANEQMTYSRMLGLYEARN